MLLGEACGGREAEQNVPFVGPAGLQLKRVLSRLGKKREDFFLTNVVRCRPPNDYLEGAPWEPSAVMNCNQYFQQALEQFRKMGGRVIVPLGNVALNKLLGFKGILDKRAPKRGYIYDYEEFKVVPTLHPSFVLQGGQNFTGVMIHDIQKSLEVASHGQPKWDPQYIQWPTTADVKRFVADARVKVGGDIWLTADIETNGSGKVDEEDLDALEESEITRISFAWQEGAAITIPWQSQFIPFIQELLMLPPYLVFWNDDFDVPRLKAKGMRLARRYWMA